MAEKLLRQVTSLERRFSRFHYSGTGDSRFRILKGRIPILISAPHAVNHFRAGSMKNAEKYTGALAILLHRMTGCHVIYASGSRKTDPNFNPSPDDKYKASLVEYVRTHSIKFVIDLHGAAEHRPFTLELGTAPTDSDFLSSLKGNDYIIELIRYSLDYASKENGTTAGLSVNQIFKAGSENTVTNFVSRQTDAACVQMEINAAWRDPARPDLMLSLITCLRIVVETLDRVDWRPVFREVRRLRQSPEPKPQDRIKIPQVDEGKSLWSDGEVVYIHSAQGRVDLAHVCLTCSDIQAGTGAHGAEDVFLPNRLIHHICADEWRLDADGDPIWEGIPVVITRRSDADIDIPVGMPKADKINKIFLSKRLYDRMMPLSGNRLFYVYNRFTDSSIQFDLQGADYGDGGTVQLGGKPAEKVMLPRYFRILMGLNDDPFSRIRIEEFERFLAGLTDSAQRDAVQRCYETIPGEVYMLLKQDADREDLEIARSLFKKGGCYAVDLLSFPAPAPEKKNRFAGAFRSLGNRVMERIVGSSLFLLRTSWTSETDDKNGVARLSPNMMSLLGVSDNDKIIIRYGGRSVKLRVLSDPQRTDYEAGVPAPARKSLQMNSVYDIVEVSRDIRHTFLRNSQAQTIAILGTVLAVFQVIKDFWTGVALCLLFVPLIIYFSLNEERIKVK